MVDQGDQRAVRGGAGEVLQDPGAGRGASTGEDRHPGEQRQQHSAANGFRACTRDRAGREAGMESNDGVQGNRITAQRAAKVVWHESGAVGAFAQAHKGVRALQEPLGHRLRQATKC